MRENPYQRRGARAQQPAQVEIEVGGVTVCQGPKSDKKAWKIPAAQKGRDRMVDEGVEEEQITVHVSRGGRHSLAKAEAQFCFANHGCHPGLHAPHKGREADLTNRSSSA